MRDYEPDPSADEALREEVARLREVNVSLLAACKRGLRRIESDIESGERQVPEGRQMRAAIALAEKAGVS